jgi:hypothetical protein
VGPGNATGELAQERGGDDATGTGRDLSHVGDVAAYRVS